MPEARAVARMIFRETSIGGVWVVEPERHEDERGFFARTWDSDEFARARADGRARPVQRLVQPTVEARCAGCTTRPRRTRRRSSCAAPRARSSTSPSTCGRSRRRSASWVGVELSRGEPARAVHSGGLRARLPDARRTTSEVAYQISAALRPRRRPWRALGRSGVRDRRGRETVVGDQRARRGVSRTSRRRGDAVTAVAPVAVEAGERMHALAAELFPICRSITGDGVRETLREIGARIPLEIHEVPSGTQVLDWTVPDEWNIRDAYIATADGGASSTSATRISTSSATASRFAATMTLDELRPHLHTHAGPAGLDPVPHVVLHADWGFCLSQRQLDALEDGDVRGRRSTARWSPAR